jgi:hypothetical protein
LSNYTITHYSITALGQAICLKLGLVPTGAAGAPSPKASTSTTGGAGDAALDAEVAKVQAASAAAKVQSRYRLDEGFFSGVLAVPKVRGTLTAL